MPDPRTPTFSSPKLQAVVVNAQPVLEGVDEARNRVSNDIKALEAYLRTLDLKNSFRYPLGKCLVSDDQYIGAALEYGGSGSGVIKEEALAWGEHTTGNFRLLFEESRWEGSIDIDMPGGPYFWEEDTLEREAKPLIETKFEIRKRMYSRLPDFVAALARHFDIEAGRRASSEDVPS